MVNWVLFLGYGKLGKLRKKLTTERVKPSTFNNLPTVIEMPCYFAAGVVARGRKKYSIPRLVFRRWHSSSSLLLLTEISPTMFPILRKMLFFLMYCCCYRGGQKSFWLSGVPVIIDNNWYCGCFSLLLSQRCHLPRSDVFLPILSQINKWKWKKRFINCAQKNYDNFNLKNIAIVRISKIGSA